jgi:hypothetical protein
MYKIALDIGYSQTKIGTPEKLYKLPTAVSYAIDSGVDYGEDEVYEFEGKRYRVGDVAVDEAFTTTEYKFLYKYAPLILFHVINKLGLIQNGQLTTPIELRTGLALTDWKNKDEFLERLKNFTVNGINVNINDIKIIPQGAGVYYDYIHTKSQGEIPSSVSVIDIGYKTINFLYFEDNLPIKSKCKAFPGHGVVSIIRPFTNWLESQYSERFTEQEAIKILLKKKFIYGGEEQPQVIQMINELKSNFIDKLFNSILVSEKKLLGTSERVIIAGGGAYFLEDVQFPKNVDFVLKPYELSNVRGYLL